MRIEMDAITKEELKSTEIVPREIDVRGRKFYPKNFAGDGFKGVVWRGLDELEGDVAIKFTVCQDYDTRSYLQEAKLARKLLGKGVFAQYIDCGLVEFKLSGGENKKFVCFIEEFVDGWTLPVYLANHEVKGSFLLNYVREICEALSTLQELGLCHDDLRQANVMLYRSSLSAIGTAEIKVKIIDMGSLKPVGQASKKEKDDHRWFAEHLIDIYNAIRQRKFLTLAEKRFMNATRHLLDRMLEDDRGIALWMPSKVLTTFDTTYTRTQAPLPTEPELTDPFDYIAAEHIQSDKILVDLFAESCPWFDEVASPNPVLLTGPRGCGKSMVFRRLSLKALLYKTVEDIRASKIAGFYVSCSADLRNRLGWMRTDALARRFRREIVHYFNLLLTREVVQTLVGIVQRTDREETFGFGKSEEDGLHAFLMDKLGITDSERLYLHGVSPMEHAIECIESEMDKCYDVLIRNFNMDRTSDTAFLATLTRFLGSNITYFADRKITFLVDDFSVHRLPKPVQTTLNPVIWDRQATHIFKLSSEKYGAAGLDELAAAAELARELREIDCGQFYINVGDRQTRRFAEELLAIRLRLTKYQGTPRVILGESKYEEGSLGKELRARSQKKGRIDDQYYGLETLADICSGDISNLLEVYRRIFDMGHVNSQTREMVPRHIQHAAVQSVSRDLLNIIRSYVPLGEEMFKIAYQFGTLSRRILREGRLQKKGASRIPNETSRIEVDQPPTQPREEFHETQEMLMSELVRRAIFIEMELGRSRHKFTPSLRWQLRRIYCPACGTSLAKNTAVKWNTAEFKKFLIDAEDACEEEFRKRWSNDRNHDSQPELPFP